MMRAMRMALALVMLIGVGAGLVVPPRSPAPSAPAPAPRSASPVVVAPALSAPAETRVDRAPGGHFELTAQVNDAPVRFLVDTGADVVALSEADARAANIAFDPLQYRVIGHGAGGAEVRGAPVRIAAISLGDHRVEGVEGAVIEGGDRSLLGQSFLARLGEMRITGDTMTLR